MPPLKKKCLSWCKTVRTLNDLFSASRRAACFVHFFRGSWKGPDMFSYNNEILFLKKGSYVEMSGTMIKINK